MRARRRGARREKRRLTYWCTALIRAAGSGRGWRVGGRGHRVYAPTLDGCAERKSAVRPGITTETQADEVAQLLFYEDLKDVVLTGTSSGGMVACRVAELMRDRRRSLGV